MTSTDQSWTPSVIIGYRATPKNICDFKKSEPSVKRWLFYFSINKRQSGHT